MNTVNIYASILEKEARQQIELISKSPAFKESHIAIMPDAHAGKGCVVGFTGKFDNAVIPNIIGVDIGCGVICYKLKCKEIDFVTLDKYIRDKIPLGCKARVFTDYEKIDSVLSKQCLNLSYKIEDDFGMLVKKDRPLTPPSLQIGTLGGGNHFIEIDIDDNGNRYLLIHSGSRNLGLKVCNYYQHMAKEYVKKNKIKVEQDLEFLPLEHGGSEYIRHMQITQEYAHYNRMMMLSIILKGLGERFEKGSLIESVHNYIGKDRIVRKGAISAYENETVVIPLNMADGIIIGVGKSNKGYNFSAPHGAGRMYSRSMMNKKLQSGALSLEDFNTSMEGIFSTSISADTIDESKFAYKPADVITKEISDTVDIKAILKPVYNLKASM